MGKKGNNWLCVLKRVFTTTSRDKPPTTTHERIAKGRRKRWVFGSLSHAPSSIEKILQEAEGRGRPNATVIADNVEEQCAPAPAVCRPQNLYDHLQTEQEDVQLHPNSHCTSEDELQSAPEPVAPSLRPVPCRKIVNWPPQETAAIKIQTAFRGHLARRSYQAIRGLIRLQMMLRSQSVRRQTMSTMKCMQQLVRVQTLISARRLQMLDRHSLLTKPSMPEDDKELEAPDEWDDSILTKEETDARLQRKVEAALRRERALAYAYSNQVLKGMSKSAQALLWELRTAQLPWAWNWMERRAWVHLLSQHQAKNPSTSKPKFARPGMSHGSNGTQPRLDHEPAARLDAPATPRSSSWSTLPTRGRSPVPAAASVTAPPWHRNDHKVKDDESSLSCPVQFSSPNYMMPTVSAHAKVKDKSSMAHDLEPSKRRFSFGSANKPISSIGWHRDRQAGVVIASGNEGSNSQSLYQSTKGWHSPGTMSIDSAMSLPIGLAAKAY